MKIIQAILNEPRLNDYKISVIKGRFWDDPGLDTLITENYNRIELYENVENMADLMLQSTMAISAGGSTLYELFACAVPTVTFSYADNQLGNVNGFSERGIMLYAGDARTTPNIGSGIAQNLLTYHENDDIIQDKVIRTKNLNCRDGVKHLAESLLES